MKASYYQGNKTLTVGDAPHVPPGPGEVRIDVAYCGICGTDLHIYQGHMDKRVKIPQIMGHEMSGTLAEIGQDVEGWTVGERVVVRPLDPCGECPACRAGHGHICYRLKFLGVDTPGAFQGAWTVPAHTLHRIPADMPLDKAALIEPVAVACHDVRRGGVQAGEFAAVIGGGPIGMLVALVARQAGARVLISEINPYRLKLAAEMGFEAVNPAEVDLVRLVEERTAGAGADVVFEVSGSQPGATTMTQLARTRGRIVVVAIFAFKPEVDLHRCFWRELTLIGTRVYEPQDFERAIELVATGAIDVEPLISARLPLGALQSAFEDIKAGKNLMKVLIDTREV
ncbi:MAG: alcohol dehydrogenase catalytic domain-containing protein [Anaerolineae bacterium]|nr:alcohol dehydrogenase catalytic domain-containing protein [Anaerolineae bacterium]